MAYLILVVLAVVINKLLPFEVKFVLAIFAIEQGMRWVLQ